jgi:two-component system, OmpR family, sensor histidine kinase KdpD
MALLQTAKMLLLVAACTVLNWLLAPYLSATDAAMVYLLGVMLLAVQLDRVVSVMGAIVSFLAFDFFFVPPTFTLRFGSTQYLITGLILLVAGVMTSTLAARARRGMEASARAALAANEERLRNALLASISHDLRTPLAVIAGSASSLRENRTKMSIEEQDQLLDTIFRRSVSMTTEVSDLLEMTRLQASRVALDRQWYPIEELVGAALERSRPVLEGHPITVDLPRDMCLVHVDGGLIEKLFVNLVENAALHTPPETKIQIVGSVHERTLVVAVRDEGPGLPPGSEDVLFEKFERGKRAGMSSGSGLGLSICRAIAELHGIEISAANRPEGGAEFTVRFPVEPAPAMPANA